MEYMHENLLWEYFPNYTFKNWLTWGFSEIVRSSSKVFVSRVPSFVHEHVGGLDEISGEAVRRIIQHFDARRVTEVFDFSLNTWGIVSFPIGAVVNEPAKMMKTLQNTKQEYKR